jgi:hypothetical protein
VQLTSLHSQGADGCGQPTKAHASGTAQVLKACLKVDGVAVSVNTANYHSSLYSADFDPATGCWTATNNNSLYSLSIEIDTSPWTKGSHTLVWWAYDNNGRQSLAASRTFSRLAIASAHCLHKRKWVCSSPTLVAGKSPTNSG